MVESFQLTSKNSSNFRGHHSDVVASTRTDKQECCLVFDERHHKHGLLPLNTLALCDAYSLGFQVGSLLAWGLGHINSHVLHSYQVCLYHLRLNECKIWIEAIQLTRQCLLDHFPLLRTHHCGILIGCLVSASAFNDLTSH